jgi:hypothetical protein
LHANVLDGWLARQTRHVVHVKVPSGTWLELA